jgi:hypothetical protein
VFPGSRDVQKAKRGEMHSREEVVNDIGKHPKEVLKVIKMVPRRAPGPPFWVPRGGWTSLLGFFGSNVAPQRAPGRLLEEFGAHLAGHFEPKINEIRT